jgi:FtsP/CotA-like multicopper oxidase with cupredoxin domain
MHPEVVSDEPGHCPKCQSRWMAHCHIAEHHESGMMFSFDVDE